MRSYLIGLATLIGLAACDAPPLTSMVALSRVDWTQTEASALRIAVAVPETIQLVENEVRLTGSLTNPDNAPSSTYQFRLKEVDEAGPGLENAPGQVRIFALADTESQRDFNTFRRDAEAAEQAEAQMGEDRDGSLGVDPKLCRTTPSLPTTLPVVMYVKPAELPRFVPLNRPADMIAEAKREGTSVKELEVLLPPCA